MSTPEARQRAGMIAELTKLAATQTGEERERTLAAIHAIALAPTLEAAAAEARLIIPAPPSPIAEIPPAPSVPVTVPTQGPAPPQAAGTLLIDRRGGGTYGWGAENQIFEIFEPLDLRYITLGGAGWASTIHVVNGLQKTLFHVGITGIGDLTVTYQPPGQIAKVAAFDTGGGSEYQPPQILNDSFPLPLVCDMINSGMRVRPEDPVNVKICQVNSGRWIIGFNDPGAHMRNSRLHASPLLNVTTTDYVRWDLEVWDDVDPGRDHRLLLADQPLTYPLVVGRTYPVAYDLIAKPAAEVPVVGLPQWLNNKISGGLSTVTGWYDRLSTGVLGWLTGFRPGMLDAFKTFGSNPLAPATSNKNAILSEANVALFKRSLKPEMFETSEMQDTVRRLVADVVSGRAPGLTTNSSKVDPEDPPGLVVGGTLAGEMPGERYQANVAAAAEAGDTSGYISNLLLAPVTALRAGLETKLSPAVPVTFDGASQARDKLIALTIDFALLAAVLDMVLCFMSVTLMRNLHAHIGHMIAILDLQGLMKTMTEPMVAHAITRPLDYGYAAKYKTQRPDPAVLMRAARLGVLKGGSAAAFPPSGLADALAEHGFSESWVKVMWAASLEVPGFMDYVVKWARDGKGKPDLVDLKAKLLSVYDRLNMDLPDYADLFVNRPFFGPSMLAIRSGYELGVYSKDDVEKWMRWNMVHPDWWDGTFRAITQFPVRSWNRRFINAVGKEYLDGVISRDAMYVKLRSVIKDEAVVAACGRALEEEHYYQANKSLKGKPGRKYALGLSVYGRAYKLGAIDRRTWDAVLAESELSSEDRSLVTKLYGPA